MQLVMLLITKPSILNTGFKGQGYCSLKLQELGTLSITVCRKLNSESMNQV